MWSAYIKVVLYAECGNIPLIPRGTMRFESPLDLLECLVNAFYDAGLYPAMERDGNEVNVYVDTADREKAQSVVDCTLGTGWEFEENSETEYLLNLDYREIEAREQNP